MEWEYLFVEYCTSQSIEAELEFSSNCQGRLKILSTVYYKDRTDV